MFTTVQKPVSTPMRQIAEISGKRFPLTEKNKSWWSSPHRAKVDYLFGNLDERRVSSGPYAI